MSTERPIYLYWMSNIPCRYSTINDVLDQSIGHRFGSKFHEHAGLINTTKRMEVAYFVVSDRWDSTIRHRVADIMISQGDAATPWAIVVF